MTPSTRHKRGTEVHRKKTKKRTFKAQDLIDKPLEVLEHLLQSKEIDQETKLDLFLCKLLMIIFDFTRWK